LTKNLTSLQRRSTGNCMIQTNHFIVSFSTQVRTYWQVSVMSDQQYRTRPVLEFMDIIDGPRQQSPDRRETGVRPRKRKSDEIGQDEEDENDQEMDVKPGQDAILTARLQDLKVSRQDEVMLIPSAPDKGSRGQIEEDTRKDFA
jgi:hypothetical protein